MSSNHSKELWKIASTVVGDGGLCLLSTADAEGQPHATWMNAHVLEGLVEIVAVTAPNTDKVANVRANPRAEWMFSSSSMETVIYLSGPTEIVTDPDKAEALWHAVPRKSKAYFRQYSKSDSPTDFSIIRTLVERVQHCRPPGYRKSDICGNRALGRPSEVGLSS